MDKDKILDDYWKLIRKNQNNLTIEQLNDFFDFFIKQFNEIDEINHKYSLIEKMLLTLNHFSQPGKILSQSNVLNHHVFILLRDFLLVQQIDVSRRNFFHQICRLFHNISSNITDENIHLMKHLFLSSNLIHQISSYLNEITNYFDDHLSLRSIGLLILSYKNLRRVEMSNDEYILIEPIKRSVMKCLSSSDAQQILEKLEKSFVQKIDDIQMFYFDTLIRYLQWYSSDHYHPNEFIPILKNLMNKYIQWLIHCDSNEYFQCSAKLVTLIRHLSAFLIRPIESNSLYIFSDLFYSDYSELIHYWSKILCRMSLNERNIRMCERIAIQNVYNLTLHWNIVHLMKRIPNLIEMLLKTSEMKDDEVQLNSFRSLGKLMNEKDIKTMNNSNQIVQIHLEFIRRTIDDLNNKQRFISLLESLKNFVQHDQVKSEIIEQKGLPLLIKCIFEYRYDQKRVPIIALEIVLSLSFNDEAFLLLKNDSNFIDDIHRLISRNTSGEIERVGENLLWKLEKEQILIQQNRLTNSCDIMISYSHKNQQIPFQIHQQLTQHGFNVWIDRDCLRGSTMVGMANAIENSHSVILCMSTSYKQSVYCQSEAHYAFERGCQIVPIIIESNYKPDGWLGIIVSGKIYVDFTNQNFQEAYQGLKNQFTHQISISNNNTIDDNHLPIIPQNISSLFFSDYPLSLTDWTEEHVQNFLMEMKLEKSFVLLCRNMNGIYLLHLYQMCLNNEQSMFITLKHQLDQQHHQLLTIFDFIHFLQQIRKYIPKNLIQHHSRPSCQII